MSEPTRELFEAYRAMFFHFNDKLFDGKLPEVILNFSRKSKAHGFFAPYRWEPAGASSTDPRVHEISLNPESTRRDAVDVASTLVHEMVHHWQQVHGKPSRSGYHNKEWAAKMREVGLVPVSYDQPGKEVGQKVGHTVDPDGRFLATFKALPANALPWTCSPESSGGKSGAKNKVKYECACGLAVWGKPELNIMCGDCHEPLEEV